MERKHWLDYPIEETVYGHHKDGIGVYRFDPVTYKPVEYWLDYEWATEDEKVLYKKYLEDNGLDK